MHPINTCPATCELCGNWLPQHQNSCPRNGVHPSQWSLSQALQQDALKYCYYDDDNDREQDGASEYSEEEEC